MNAKRAPLPKITPETITALLGTTAEFAAAKPWKDMADCDLVGLTDPITGETRLATVLGNGGEVFGAVSYRRASGLRWIFEALGSSEALMNLDAMAGMDCLKVELVPKREMLKEDLDLLKPSNFKPLGKGSVWPQFRSAAPGWLPWFIDETEAGQLLADLRCLNKFYALLREHPGLFEEHLAGEIPFLPNPMPDRPLLLTDLDWRPVLSIPKPHEPFRATEQQLAQLRLLEQAPKARYQYVCRLLPGGAVVENGRPRYNRISMLVESRRGLVLGFELSPGTLALSESAGLGLAKSLEKNGFLPGEIFIDDARMETILQPLCDALQIKLLLVRDLVAVNEAMESLRVYLQTATF